MATETVGDMHIKLYEEWGVVMPVGEHPDIGMGGHISGGLLDFYAGNLACAWIICMHWKYFGLIKMVKLKKPSLRLSPMT